MYRLRQDIHRHIRCHIERAIDDLRQRKTKYVCNKYLLCDGCSLRKPLQTRKCGSCGSRDFSEEYCQQALRLSWFFDWLEACRLWPISYQENRSCQSLIEKVNACIAPPLLQGSWVHSCEAEDGCPHEVARRAVLDAVRKAPQNVKGLRLRDYRPLND